VDELLTSHLARRADYSDALLALLTFSIWSEQVRPTQ
jgi:hypothetical protein